MSRVRILNVPRLATEQTLRTFFTSKLPPSAPAIDITDCFIKKSSDGASIKMAFLGFKTAAAGQFVVKHFNGSYLQNCKLRVEAATGLNESVTTVNMRKKLEAHVEKNADGGEGGSKSAARGGRLPTYLKDADSVRQEIAERSQRKRAREDREAHHSAAAESHKAEEESRHDPEYLERVQARKKEFVAERLKEGGPSWSGEVLVPESTSTNNDDEGVTVGDANRHNTTAALLLSEEIAKLEAEAAALEKQQKLAVVSDLDFLASLTGGGGGGGGGGVSENSKEAEVNEDTAVQPVEHTATVSDVPSEGTSKKPRKTRQEYEKEELDAQKDLARTSRRILLRGIPFTATETEVKNFISSKIGPVEDVHVPLTRDTKQSKGSAFVRMAEPEDAARAIAELQGAIFMGRLVKLVAVEEDPYKKKAEETAAKLSKIAGGPTSEFKQQRSEEQKQTDASGISWNATYMNTHTAVETMAKRLGVQNRDILSVEAKGGAVRAAIAEAFLTSEVKSVFGDEGIDLEALSQGSQSLLKSRSDTTILVKNLSPKADLQQLSKMFLKFGSLDATAIPSSGAFALFRFVHAQDARVAFQRLAYKPFCGQPLFVEWAPIGTLKDGEEVAEALAPVVAGDENDKEAAAPSSLDAPVKSQQPLTLFVTNIPFTTKEDQWVTFLQDAAPRIASNFSKFITKLHLQSDKGRCFLTCSDAPTFSYVLTKLNGKMFSGRAISCVASKSNASVADQASAVPATAEIEDTDKAQAAGGRAVAPTPLVGGGVPAGCNPLKVIVKNLPFEATESDLRELFGAFTEIKAVRVPKKVNQFGAHRDNNHRGFGFVEFLTEQEAASAIKALSSTHLYGRHLVLQYAKLGDN